MQLAAIITGGICPHRTWPYYLVPVPGRLIGQAGIMVREDYNKVYNGPRQCGNHERPGTHIYTRPWDRVILYKIKLTILARDELQRDNQREGRTKPQQ